MEKLHAYLPGDSRERIQDLLIERKMTQAQLAEKLEISESSLNRYISGQTDKLSTENVVKMARIFGCLYGLPVVRDGYPVQDKL